MAGVWVNVTSVCHQLARSTLPSMASTSVLSSMEGSTGWASVTMPNWRAKSACCSRGEGLVAEEDDVVRVQRVAHGGDHRGANGTERSMPPISAPMVGESGCTLRLVARVTEALCPTSARPHSIRSAPRALH